MPHAFAPTQHHMFPLSASLSHSLPETQEQRGAKTCTNTLQFSMIGQIAPEN